MQAIASFLSLALLFLLIPIHALAGAWVKPQGSGEVIVNALYFTSDGFYDRNGNETAQPRFDKYEINPYLEYGLTDQWTIGANLFLHYIEQAANLTGSKQNYGLADSEFFARYQLLKLDYSTLSIQPLIKAPSAYSQGDVPRAGSDSIDAELSILGGHSFEWFGRHHYAELRAGYRHRFDSELEDQYRLDAKLGLSIADNWQFIPAVYTIISTTDDRAPTFTEDGQNDYNLYKIEAMLRHDLSKQHYVQFGGFKHIDGRNVGNGLGLVISGGMVF